MARKRGFYGVKIFRCHLQLFAVRNFKINLVKKWNVISAERKFLSWKNIKKCASQCCEYALRRILELVIGIVVNGTIPGLIAQVGLDN